MYVTAAKVQREFGLFGVTSATVIAFLLGAALYTTAHYKKKHGLQDQLSYCRS